MVNWDSTKEPIGRVGQGVMPPALGDRMDKLAKRSSRDITIDENISILDPRRFTPTLHANLVSEILSLRRDQDEKLRVIESLETTLHATKEEHKSLQQNFATVSKESRSMQRQMSLLEGGTSSALGELARERDEAVDSTFETKKRLDAAQKKIRTQEDDSQRVHDMWEKEKLSWENEKRNYERKLHVAESRLKGVLEEVTAFQTAHAEDLEAQAAQKRERDGEENIKDDGASIRTMSLTNSLRFSVLSSPTGQPIGNSLADELGFDADDDEHTDDAHDEPFSSPEPQPTPSFRNSSPVRRNILQSIDSAAQANMTPKADAVVEASKDLPRPIYVETGVQYSPPSSPVPAHERLVERDSAVMRLVKTLESGNASRNDVDIEANQRRKRTQVHRISNPGMPLMTSSAAQTATLPLSPPWTPKLDEEEAAAVFSGFPPKLGMVSSCTQTELPIVPVEVVVSPPAPAPAVSEIVSPTAMPIPSISIQPPTSRPASPRIPRLPQHFKDFGCQVNISYKAPTSDSSVQTEGIKVDQRLAKLPPHLQPSSITSRPSSPVESRPGPETNFTPVPGNRLPLRIPTLRGDEASQLSGALKDSHADIYPGNDDGPLSGLQESAIRRPRRISSLFAGFESATSDDGEEFGEADVSDSEYRTALSAPRPFSLNKNTRRQSSATGTTSPDASIHQRMSSRPSKPYNSIDLVNSFGIMELDSHRDSMLVNQKHSRMSSRTSDKSSAMLSSHSNYTGMRKAAMINNQYNRSRSPSLPENKNPPYPIPQRDSSKRVPSNPYTSSDGRSSPIRGDAWVTRSNSRDQYSATNVRRVRSAAALPKSQRQRRARSRSPPPLSVSTEAPESPGLPPLPQNDLTSSYSRDRSGSYYHRHRADLSTNTAHTHHTYNTDPMSVSQDSGSQTSGVVDAIAQTMVGEWMFKYVRKRKSFSVPDSVVKDDAGNDRHKRWVWLAPYERSILWSSRQPSSGSALMGKSGRKLTIQSVLDVKDDNPAPKTSGPIFNRSILILTPQRALKFTATSADRHYVWLTALSFLAHSTQAIPEIMAAPQAPLPIQQQPLPEFELPQSKVRRGGIRDSIRIAKGRTSTKGPGSAPSIPSAPTSRRGEGTAFPIPMSSGTVASMHFREDSREAAVPPMIARFSDRTGPVSSHGRKRSNTGGHVPPPLSFRGFSGPVGSPALTDSTANNSVETGASDMNHSHASSNTTWAGESQRTSEASSRPGNFFDAVGTVRMEAFISPLAPFKASEDVDERDDMRRRARRRSKEIRRRNSRSRQRDNYSRGGRGYDDYYGGSRTAGEEEYFREDPFKGF
ncbi:hypothetical protein VHEMI10212 [[Torrubiella] hemipterigena]|uniref:Pleckstrin homology domain-containing protein n=1 Tax=[Torrubiella] hemipterigena TaxID=1531966 RepID=A0A0A1TRI6_9HYPO|nr:hypothetical protein VHEMI10212 [[Torrubiella] hemipterigena]